MCTDKKRKPEEEGLETQEHVSGKVSSERHLLGSPSQHNKYTKLRHSAWYLRRIEEDQSQA
jgi:hypothetical protein